MKTKTAKQTAQQGDVILRKLKAFPEEGERKIIGNKTLVLAHGENGHSHVIEDEDAELIQIGERMLLNLERAATVTHPEHKPIKLSPGIWEIGRVTEYDWISRIERQVVD